MGTVVGANWRGMDIIRSRPKASGGTPTDAQLMQRKKFALAIKFQNALRTMQSRLYGDDAGVKSRVNLAASYLLKEVVGIENGEAVLMMPRVLITKGDLPGFQNLQCTPAPGQVLQFAWEDNSAQVTADASDLFSAAVYEEESGVFSVSEGPAVRSDQSAETALPADCAGKTVHIYAFFQTAGQNAASTSVYLGTATVV